MNFINIMNIFINCSREFVTIKCINQICHNGTNKLDMEYFIELITSNYKFIKLNYPESQLFFAIITPTKKKNETNFL